MRIQSHDVALAAFEMYRDLNEIKKKISFYSEDEVKRYNSSHFVFDIDENELIKLNVIYKYLTERDNISIDSSFSNLFAQNYDKCKKIIIEFNLELDKIFKSETGSLEESFFYISFFMHIKDFISVIKDLYQSFLERIEIKDLVKNKDRIDDYINQMEVNKNNIMNSYTEIEKKSKENLIKLEQKVADRDILDIKDLYESLLKKINCEINLYGILFIISSLLLLAIFIFLFNSIESFYNEKYLLPRSVITVSFIGFFIFIINDIRKRFNIVKQIADEIYQKKIVVDTYSSLLSKIDKFDSDTKKCYHNEILNNIISTLLSIKDHGYLSKQMNKEIPDVTKKILDKLDSIKST